MSFRQGKNNVVTVFGNAAAAASKANQAIGKQYEMLRKKAEAWGEAIDSIGGAYAAILPVIKGIYQYTIAANEQLNLSLLKSQAVLASNTAIFDAYGKEITDTTDKVASFANELRDQRKLLEQETKDIVGVTSEFTIQVYDKLLLYFKGYQGQTKMFKDDLTAIRKLATNLTAVLGTLDLTDAIQLEQEVRSLSTGDINNPGALAARTLGLSHEEYNKAASMGEKTDLLIQRSASFLEANKLGAQTITNEVSNIIDTLQIMAREMSKGLELGLAKDLYELRVGLEERLGDPAFMQAMRDNLSQLIDTLVALGKAIFNAGKQLIDSDIGPSILDTVVFALNGIEKLANAFNALQKATLEATGKLLEFIGVKSKLKQADNSEAEAGSIEATLEDAKRLVNKEFNAFELTANAIKGTIDKISNNAGSDFVKSFATDVQSLMQYGQEMNEILTKTGDLQKAYARQDKKLGLDKMTKELNDFSKEAGSFTTKPDKDKLSKLQLMREVFESRSLSGGERGLDPRAQDMLKLIDEAIDAETNASIENFNTRQQVYAQLEARFKAIADPAEIKRLQEYKQDLEKAIVEGKEAVKNDPNPAKTGSKELLASLIKQYEDFSLALKQAGIDLKAFEQTVIQFKQAPKLGDMTEQITTRLLGAVNMMRKAVEITDFASAYDELIGTINAGLEYGAISIEDAYKMLSDAADLTTAAYEQKMAADQAITSEVYERSLRNLANNRQILQDQMDQWLAEVAKQNEQSKLLPDAKALNEAFELNDAQNNVKELTLRLEDLHKELATIQATPTGESDSATRKKAADISAKRTEIANMQAELAKGHVAVAEQEYALQLRLLQVATQRAKSASELLKLNEQLANIRGSSFRTDEEQAAVDNNTELVALLTERKDIQDELAGYIAMEAKTAEERLSQEQKILELRKALLQNEISIEQIMRAGLLDTVSLAEKVRDVQSEQLKLAEQEIDLQIQLKDIELQRLQEANKLKQQALDIRKKELQYENELKEDFAANAKNASESSATYSEAAKSPEAAAELYGVKNIDPFAPDDTFASKEPVSPLQIRAQIDAKKAQAEADKQAEYAQQDKLATAIQQAKLEQEAAKAAFEATQAELEAQYTQLELEKQKLTIAEERAKMEQESADMQLQAQKTAIALQEAQLKLTMAELEAKAAALPADSEEAKAYRNFADTVTNEVLPNLAEQTKLIDTQLELGPKRLQQTLSGINAERAGIEVQQQAIALQAEQEAKSAAIDIKSKGLLPKEFANKSGVMPVLPVQNVGRANRERERRAPGSVDASKIQPFTRTRGIATQPEQRASTLVNIKRERLSPGGVDADTIRPFTNTRSTAPTSEQAFVEYLQKHYERTNISSQLPKQSVSVTNNFAPLSSLNDAFRAAGL